jgi:putative aldouronate transport system permease protein
MIKRRRHRISVSQLTWTLVMLFLAIVTVYPFWYCLIYAFSSAQLAAQTNVVLLPAGFTLENFRSILRIGQIYSATLISVYRTVAGVVYTVVITGLASYAIAQRRLPGNRAISLFLIIPMYISGGLLPTYVLINRLGLFNNLLVYILPHGFWAFNMLIMRTYFDTIPEEMAESARMDGASEWTIFFKVIFPLAMPVIAVIAMFSGVWQWNSWFDAELYMTRPQLLPLQNVLQSFLRRNEADMVSLMQGEIRPQAVSAETIRMTILIVTVLPIIFIYPFFQKYFIRGVMIGAIKA